MSQPTTTGGRRGMMPAAVVSVVLAVAAVIAVVVGLQHSGPPQPSSSPVAAVTAPAATVTTTPAPTTGTARPKAAPPDFGPVLAPSNPVSIDVPSIKIHSTRIVDLAIGKNGDLQAPKDFQTPGWYAAGPAPGELGAFVIGGHVDSVSGPAVFYRLGELKAGAVVTIARKDGTKARFSIDEVGRYKKTDFPTSRVYGNTKRAEIRLITCGGAFDRSSGHYVDNIVAFGHLMA